ncbi:MAG: S-methyl-5'-thioadenosine phosphorylase [Lentisphaerae bacterium]|nr:MAG: S-methyl-5'-thioadenosine phosphorylase [Lentisphaerota bacterium]
MTMKIGVIGGSGIYDIEGLNNLTELSVDTPFGQPSDNIIRGDLAGNQVFFLARHGKGHRILPSELNHRANIFAMKKLGVEAIVSMSAVGSFREELRPGDIVLVDQFVDRTRRPGIEHTFFGNGIVAHIGFSQPTCAHLREILHQTIQDMLNEANPHGIQCVNTGTYLNMEGPAFSTLAESKLYRSWGMDIIGMTNLAEARLAREAEICYQTVALVTDYDCWHEEFAPVDVQMIIKTLQQNACFAKQLITRVVPVIGEKLHCESCRNALAGAIVTHPDHIPSETRRNLEPIIGRYLPA